MSTKIVLAFGTDKCWSMTMKMTQSMSPSVKCAQELYWDVFGRCKMNAICCSLRLETTDIRLLVCFWWLLWSVQSSPSNSCLTFFVVLITSCASGQNVILLLIDILRFKLQLKQLKMLRPRRISFIHLKWKCYSFLRGFERNSKLRGCLFCHVKPGFIKTTAKKLHSFTRYRK